MRIVLLLGRSLLRRARIAVERAPSLLNVGVCFESTHRTSDFRRRKADRFSGIKCVLSRCCRRVECSIASGSVAQNSEWVAAF